MTETQTPYYITTAIDYVNAAPHLGHAYEKIAADTMARFQRLTGKKVFFLTGTDEHGSKVQKTARSKDMDPKSYTDTMAQSFRDAWHHLGISYDRFIRTTDPDHYEVVKHLWQVLSEKGDIYKASYTGLYCSGCELFLSKRDLNEEGQCPIHMVPPEPVEEENYFFKLSAYKDKLIAHIQNHPEFVQPDFRRQEVLKMLEDLEDISVSRSTHSVAWGIPVPNDPDQTIYVWIDALSNYITGVGYQHNENLFKTYWPADVHLIGKDILRFHAIYWPAMLMGANLPLPKTVFAHGFITVNDAKISKSLGNVISPFALTERFSLPHADPIRYYLMTTTTFGNDGNFSEEDFKLRVNADLANNLGNLLNRTLNMTQKYFEGNVPTPASPYSNLPLVQETLDKLPAIEEAYGRFAFQEAMQLILDRVDAANRLINDVEPWTLFKNQQLDQLADTMYALLETLRQVAILISPVTPTMAQGIWDQLGYVPEQFAEQRWVELQNSSLPYHQGIAIGTPLLPRLDSEIAGTAKKQK